ncbi:MAG: cobalt transporter CbiM, partial [Thiohalocapsa sp.]
MAHIPDGVLSAPVLITGALVSVGLLVASLRRLEDDRIPQAAVLSAAFFVSSLITIPIGPSSVHLLLNGLMGLLLGWMAVPALLVALILQAAFFGYGGLTVLGVNAMNLMLPALLCGVLLRPLLTEPGRRRARWV